MYNICKRFFISKMYVKCMLRRAEVIFSHLPFIEAERAPSLEKFHR